MTAPAPAPAPAPATAALTFTGERFTPEVRGAIWYEHWHRYCAVAPLARGRRVLDAACGEGYGSALLARTAAQVTGIDVGTEAIAHARARYAAPNLAFTQASVTALPLPDASVDLVVSFETIEHLLPQQAMLAEFRRVLAPEGVLVISSPNRPVYNEGAAIENHYHVRELDRAELKALLDPAFPRQAWHGQRVLAGSVLWSEEAREGGVAFDVLADDRPQARTAPAAPMYFLVVCGGPAAPIPTLPAVALFDDGALSLWREFERAILRERQLLWDELDARKIGEDRLAELVTAVNAASSERVRGNALAARVAALETELTALHARLAQAAEALDRESASHADTRRRLAYRETAVGWIRWPLAVARARLRGTGA